MNYFKFIHLQWFTFINIFFDPFIELFGQNHCPQTPFGYISDELTNENSPKYLTSFFDELDRNWKLKNTKWVKSFTNDRDVFISTLNERLNQAILDFLKLNEEIDEDF